MFNKLLAGNNDIFRGHGHFRTGKGLPLDPAISVYVSLLDMDDTDVGMACRNQEDISVGERTFDVLRTVTFFYIAAQSTPCGQKWKSHGTGLETCRHVIISPILNNYFVIFGHVAQHGGCAGIFMTDIGKFEA